MNQILEINPDYVLGSVDNSDLNARDLVERNKARPSLSS